LQVLEDPKFATAAQEMGSNLMDQIDRPLDRAVWWIEHVMRHPTLYAGRTPVHKLYWDRFHKTPFLPKNFGHSFILKYICNC
jgi:hypothetical protein